MTSKLGKKSKSKFYFIKGCNCNGGENSSSSYLNVIILIFENLLYVIKQGEREKKEIS